MSNLPYYADAVEAEHICQVATPPNPNHNKNPQSDGGKG